MAQQDPLLVSKTLIAEFDNTSDTASYLDTIDPYSYNMRTVYIVTPYKQYLQTPASKTDALKQFNAESRFLQTQQLQAASKYFAQVNSGNNKSPQSPVMSIVRSLTVMAQSGLYEPALANHSRGINVDDTTYTTRFLADTGVLDDTASALNITTEQYGMMREGTGHTPGAWWLLPIGLLNHTVLAGDDNGDRDAAIIFGSLLLTLLAFPFIPYLNQVPDKLKIYRLIWR